MHILILPSWYPGTPSDVKGVFFRDQALALKNAGHKVGVVVPSLKPLRSAFKKEAHSPAPYYDLDEGIATYRKSVFAVLPRLPYGNYIVFKAVAKKLVSDYIANHGKPDIIHGHVAIFGGAAAVDIGRGRGVPALITEHSSVHARGEYSKWQVRVASRAYRKAGACISVSPSLAELLEEQMPSTRGLWKWIPNVVAERFGLPQSRSEMDRPPRFLNLALMTETKGQFDLIEAFHQLTLGDFPAELWLAGDGPIRDALEEEAHRLGLLDKVRFLGLIAPDRVPELLEQVDVMVVSSHYETFGVVAAEALLAGLPVIATRCGGPECIVSDGDGLLVPPGDPKSLGAAMRQMGSSLASYDRQAIANHARDRFSGAAVAAQLTEEYERLLK